jgi:hypothetical protein
MKLRLTRSYYFYHSLFYHLSLADTKSRSGDGVTTLLHYLVTFLHQNKPECVSFIHDMAAVAAAARVDGDLTLSELSQIEAVLRSAAALLRRPPGESALQPTVAARLHARVAAVSAQYHATAAQLLVTIAAAADAMLFFGVAPALANDAGALEDTVAGLTAAAAAARTAAEIVPADDPAAVRAAWARLPLRSPRAACICASAVPAAAGVSAPHATMSWPDFFGTFAQFVSQFTAAEQFLAFRREREAASRRRDAHSATLRAIAAAGGGGKSAAPSAAPTPARPRQAAPAPTPAPASTLALVSAHVLESPALASPTAMTPLRRRVNGGTGGHADACTRAQRPQDTQSRGTPVSASTQLATPPRAVYVTVGPRALLASPGSASAAVPLPPPQAQQQQQQRGQQTPARRGAPVYSAPGALGSPASLAPVRAHGTPRRHGSGTVEAAPAALAAKTPLRTVRAAEANTPRPIASPVASKTPGGMRMGENSVAVAAAECGKAAKSLPLPAQAHQQQQAQLRETRKVHIPLSLLPPGFAYDANGALRAPSGDRVPPAQLRVLLQAARQLKAQRAAAAAAAPTPQPTQAQADGGWFSSWW